MSYRYGGKARPGSQISNWLNENRPWWSTFSAKTVNVTAINGVSVTADATAHVKGAWTQIFASTTTNSDFLIFGATLGSSGALAAGLCDIGVGASGSEVAVIENIAIGQQTNSYANHIPISIPAGSRIAIRFQSSIVSRIAAFDVVLLNTGNFDYTKSTVDVLGSNTATSEGVNLTNATWVEVSASTPKAYRSIVIVPSASNATMSNFLAVYELGVGSAGNEVSLGSINVRFTAGEQIITPPATLSYVAGPFPIGSRLSVRTDAGGGGVADVCLLGIE